MSRQTAREMAAACGQVEEARRCFYANRAWLAQSGNVNQLRRYEAYLRKLGF